VYSRGKTADNTETDDDVEDEDEEVVDKEEDDSGESGEDDVPVVKKGREGGAHRIKGGGSKGSSL